MNTGFPPPYYPPSYAPLSGGLRWRRCIGCFALPVLLCCLSSLFLTGGFFLLYEIDPPPAMNILILGDDTRPGSNEGAIARTDSILILNVNPAKKQVSLFSIPRDIALDSPQFGWLPANVIVRNAELKAPGSGITEMTATMERTFGVRIDHTVRLNFTAFVQLIDAVGGIEIDVPKQIVDSQYPLDGGGTIRIEFQPGKQHMDGATALIYARTRHADDDYQRASRQQQVIEALLEKLTQPASIGYWVKVWQILEENSQTSLAFGDIARLAPAIIRDAHSGSQIARRVIEREDLIVDDTGNSRPDMNKLRLWIEAHLDN